MRNIRNFTTSHYPEYNYVLKGQTIEYPRKWMLCNEITNKTN